jgi:hypothetical protein
VGVKVGVPHGFAAMQASMFHELLQHSIQSEKKSAVVIQFGV